MGSLVARVRRVWPCIELQAVRQQGQVSRLFPSLPAVVSREKLPPFPLCSHTPSIPPPFPPAHAPVFSCQPWNKLSSSGVCISSCRAQHEVFRTQALKFSSAASPVSEKDGNADSHGEETCVSGDEKGEPFSEAKDGPAPEVDKEQAAKAEEEDKEALLNTIAQLEAVLSEKSSQLVELKERAVTTKAELESVRTRARREADNTKKYAVQEFAKSLLDVADNLGRALTTIPANVRKELLTDQSETGKLLRSLVEGLILTERELMKVLKKFGVEKFEPVGQQFDPNSHLALFEVADPSKEAGTVALVAKVGYMLHDRILRPAEVGVVKSLE